MSVNLKIKKLKKNTTVEIPQYMSDGASGLDLCVSLDDDITLAPLERALVPTGISISIPRGYEAQIRPRSGLAIKHGVTVLNTPGTIDADYRGEIKVILINLSKNEFIIKNGERICQMVIANHEITEWIEVKDLNNTERGDVGFGHTGT